MFTGMLEQLLRWRFSLIEFRVSCVLSDREAIRIALLLPKLMRLGRQSKDSMYRSPDEADALAMTFAATRGGVRIWV